MDIVLSMRLRVWHGIVYEAQSINVDMVLSMRISV